MTAKKHPTASEILLRNKSRKKRQAIELDIDMNDDEKYIRQANLHWKDIDDRDKELVSSSLKLTAELLPFADNPDIINNLGDKKELFTKAFATFKNDFAEFLNELDAVKDKWEGRSGFVRTMEDFTVYNDVATDYNNINTKFIILTQTTIPTITLIAMEAMDRAIAKRDGKDVEEINYVSTEFVGENNESIH